MFWYIHLSACEQQVYSRLGECPALLMSTWENNAISSRRNRVSSEYGRQRVLLSFDYFFAHNYFLVVVHIILFNLLLTGLEYANTIRLDKYLVLLTFLCSRLMIAKC